MAEQRRGRSIAMNADELHAFLAEQRTCRLATLGSGGPHVSPVWFIWDRTALWIYSLTRSQRWADIAREPRVAAVIDAGEEYAELRGIELEGDAEVVGPVPRTGHEDPPLELVTPERLMAAKYWHGGERHGGERPDGERPDGGELAHDGRHAWLRVTPRKVTSWDFRKLAGLNRGA